MDNKRKIIHIDMDAFFASVEQRDHPEFIGKPLIVGGDPKGRGVVAACSYEARRFGVHSAMPCSKAVRLCPKAIFTKPRMAQYKEVSREIMDIFRNYTSLVEPLSLDEAFLDVTVNYSEQPSATLLANDIRKKIFTELQLTASAGVSFNKFLAKVASDIDKPNGITTITPNNALEFLSHLPIRKFFGVGKVTEGKMINLGIKTGRDLRNWREIDLTNHFGKAGAFLYNCVRGIDNRPVQAKRVRKSIGGETTLANDTDDIYEMRNILLTLAEKIALALVNASTIGHTITLKIRYSDFTTITRATTSRYPIFLSSDITSLAHRLLNGIATENRKIRLLGLSISKLQNKDQSPRQLLLPFPYPDRNRS